MAITINKQPTGIYPAYNDSYIEFESSLANNNRAEVIITGFTEPFTIFPDLDGVYTFNFREAVKVLFSQYSFKDEHGEAITTEWGQSLLGHYLALSTTLKVFNNSTSETQAVNHTFYRAVKQAGQTNYNNNCQILSANTNNGVDYNLTYFEGFPFSFELQRLVYAPTKRINVKNLNTGITCDDINPQVSGAFKIIVDKATTNWTTSTFLPLPDLVNRLEIYEDDSFKTNLTLKKVPSKCGIYLKWLNTEGGYSFWLFDQFYRDTLNTQDLQELATNNFKNVGEGFFADTRTMGKAANEGMRLRTNLDPKERLHLQGLFTSPYVEMYTSQDPFIAADWVPVTVSGNYQFDNKPKQTVAVVNISLPEIKTITY